MSRNASVKGSNPFVRIVITLVGVALIVMALGQAALALFGETATAQVTTTLMSKENSNEDPDLRHNWSVDWTFAVDGKEYSGRATVKGPATGVGHGNTVWYFPFAPQINSLYAKDNLGTGTLLLAGLGVLVIVLTNLAGRKSRAQTAPLPQPDAAQYAAPAQGACPPQAYAAQPAPAAKCFCRACGAQINADAAFCPVCGKQLR